MCWSGLCVGEVCVWEKFVCEWFVCVRRLEVCVWECVGGGEVCGRFFMGFSHSSLSLTALLFTLIDCSTQVTHEVEGKQRCNRHLYSEVKRVIT